MQLNLHSLAYPVTSLGPGNRLGLWVAGCKKRCQGCITPELLDPQSGSGIDVQKLLQHILGLSTPRPFDGISLSGGEPFEQARALTELLEGILSYNPFWNVLVYSGYTLPEIQRKQDAKARLLEYVDVLIDGIYQQGIPSAHPLAGSGNQKVHFLTHKGLAMKPSIEALAPNKVNLGIGTRPNQLLIGVLTPDMRRRIHQEMGIQPKDPRLKDSLGGNPYV